VAALTPAPAPHEPVPAPSLGSQKRWVTGADVSDAGAGLSAGNLRSPRRRLATRDLLIGLLVCHPPNEVVGLGIRVVRD
jgi:hypothetical protein